MRAEYTQQINNEYCKKFTQFFLNSEYKAVCIESILNKKKEIRVTKNVVWGNFFLLKCVVLFWKTLIGMLIYYWRTQYVKIP